MLQNRNSSEESAHANTEASVSGHCFDSSGKSIDFVGGNRDFFQVRKRMGLRLLLRDWNDFAAKTEFAIFMESFREIEAGLRIFLPEEKEGEKLNLE